MLDALLSPTAVPLLEQAAAFGERRHEVLTGNVANIDTPNYRRKDLPAAEFQKALKSAISARSETGRRLSHYDQAAGDPHNYFAESLRNVRTAARVNPTFQDGADRDIESDVLTMTRNLMMQSMSVDLMGSQLNLLAAVISEQP